MIIRDQKFIYTKVRIGYKPQWEKIACISLVDRTRSFMPISNTRGVSKSRVVQA